MKKIHVQSKIKALEWPQHYSLIFSEANSVVGDGILLKFNLTQAFMIVLVTCKNEEDTCTIKNKGARVATTLFIDFFRG